MKRRTQVRCSSLALALLAAASIPAVRAAEEQVHPQTEKRKPTPAATTPAPAIPEAEKICPTGPLPGLPGECPVGPQVNTLEDIVLASNARFYLLEPKSAGDSTAIVWRDVKPEQPARR